MEICELHEAEFRVVVQMIDSLYPRDTTKHISQLNSNVFCLVQPSRRHSDPGNTFHGVWKYVLDGDSGNEFWSRLQRLEPIFRRQDPARKPCLFDIVDCYRA